MRVPSEHLRRGWSRGWPHPPSWRPRDPPSCTAPHSCAAGAGPTLGPVPVVPSPRPPAHAAHAHVLASFLSFPSLRRS